MLSTGTKIRELRRINNLTQEQLGDILGVKKVTIQKYENGSIKNLKQSTITKLAETFNVSPSTFINETVDFDTRFGERVFEIQEEVYAIERFQKSYGNDAVEVIRIYTELNDTGKERVLQYLNDMSKIY